MKIFDKLLKNYYKLFSNENENMFNKILIYTGKIVLSGLIWYGSGEVFPDNEITLNNIYEEDSLWPCIVYIVRISWSSIPWFPW